MQERKDGYEQTKNASKGCDYFGRIIRRCVIAVVFSTLGTDDLACTGIVFRTGGCIRSGNKKRRKKETKEEQKQLPIVNEEGMTLAERINTPKGYTREEAEKGSLVEFLRKYSLKKSTGVVKTWDGKKAKDITNTPAVFKLPLAKENLQWAGGSVIRLYTEYLWENQMYDKISFQFSDGFAAQYQKWREGFRIRKDATGAIWVNGGDWIKRGKIWKRICTVF